MTKILNQAQAEAVYSAMCALNNVGGLLRAEMDGGDLSVQQHHKSGRVTVASLTRLPHERDFEAYADQSAFASAYGLHQD